MLRVSVLQQAFDEDLHISNVGGELISIVRAKDLKEERSRSVNASMDWYHYFGDFQANLLIEGFFTKLSDPFVLTAPVEDPNGSGYLIQTRINGSGAKVYGGTLEGKIAWRDKNPVAGGTDRATQSVRFSRGVECRQGTFVG